MFEPLLLFGDASQYTNFFHNYFLVPEMRQQLLALVDSFRMAWKIVRSSLNEDGEYCSLT